MTVRPIILWPEPWLKQRSTPVLEEEFGSPELLELCADMVHTTKAAQGLGISAPQLGVHKRVIVIPVPIPGTTENLEFLVLCNPVCTPLEGDTVRSSGMEGCLSLPGVSLRLERFVHVRVVAKRTNGADFDSVLHGLSAVAAQHECDHLEGLTIGESVGPAHQGLLRSKLRKVMRRMKQGEQEIKKHRDAAIKTVLQRSGAELSNPDDYAVPEKATSAESTACETTVSTNNLT